MPVHYHLGKFPPTNLDWNRLIPLIGPANAAVARYDALLTAMPNPDVLLSPLTTQEAVLSSKIEGTHVTIGEVLELEAGGGSETMTQPKKDDAEEVLNYRRAMQACVAEMKQRSISQHMLRGAHSILMKGVRGRDKSPGQFRNEQNWIGPKGCKIEDAKFVPIALEQLQSGMDDWENFLNSNDQMDQLVQLGLLHLEFEALHPFKDGNGRLGRMLLPLFLFQRKLLSSPDFYMSGYLEANRDEYQERLRAVSREDDWTGWCAFFLNGIRLQAIDDARKAAAILGLYDRLKLEMVDLTHSQHSIKAIDYLFQMPIFSGPMFVKYSEIPKQTASRILSLLSKAGFLYTLRQGKGRRSGIYAFSELINIAEGKDVFESHT